MGDFESFIAKSDKPAPGGFPFNLFSFDIIPLPDNSFYSSIRKRKDGSEYEVFCKGLNRRERGLFDELEIIVFEGGNKNYTFISQACCPNDAKYVRDLVDTIYSNYGPDESGKGEFGEEDIEEIVDDNFWLGRNWDGKGPSIRMSGYGSDGWSLTIWT